MNTIHRRRRGTRRVRIAIITLGLGTLVLGTSTVVEAAAEKSGRGKKLRLVAEDVDNEGPIGREGWGAPQRLRLRHLAERLDWHSPIRLDLVLPIKSLPQKPLRRR